MKKVNVNQMFKLSWLMVLAVLLGFTSCKKDTDNGDDNNNNIVLDGFYVNGDAVASASFSDKQMMSVTRNEVTQTDRASLLELYIPVKASGGFNIVEVKGSVKTTYGPDADFAVVTAFDNDEPHVPFKRGSYKETSDKFTVDNDGFYHVVIDTELKKVVVAPVHWGVIGAATPLGWGASTDMTESAFDLNKMSWSIDNLELRNGDWKFRYSGGWKIILDTALDLGNGNKGVKVNTNFGGAVDALVPGGANIVNNDPGVYSILMEYELGKGYTAAATKTGGLPLTNWDGVKCDAVGTGVSSDNTAAHSDTSSWNWGNAMLADNGGVPVKTGDVYTWTWTNIVLEANEGFKLRTMNGVAPPSGGANFDVGLEAVDHANSSMNVDQGTSGNLQVSVKGTYTIVLTIDAADNDKKVITIN